MNPGRPALTMLFFALMLAVPPCSATLVPDLDLPRLIDSSDLIVVGGVAGLKRHSETVVYIQGQPLPATSWTAELYVLKTVKGKIGAPKVLFKFAIPQAPVGYQGIDVGRFGVFFLSQTKNGYQILDPYHPYVPAAPGAPAGRGSSLDQVTGELAHVVDSVHAPVQTRRQAVEALSTLLTSSATTALQTAAHDRDPAPRVLAIAALLERGDLAWLDDAANILLSHEQGIDPYLVWRLEVAIEGRVKDPKAIPTLVRLLRAADVTVRRAAAAALRNTHDSAATEPLTQALYDSDPEVEYQAVIGLAEITGTVGEWAPASATFGKEPRRYLEYWKNWAKSRK